MKNELKKKIGIITFHIAHNYGAMLQAYALPTAVKKMGFQCDVYYKPDSYEEFQNQIYNSKFNNRIDLCG